MSFNIGAGFNGSVRVIKVLNSGNVLIAGTFTTYKGIPTGNLIKLDSNGNVVTSFEQSSYGSGDIWDIEVLYNDSTLTTINSHSIIVVGNFETVNDTQTRGIVKLKESDGSIDRFFRENSFSGTNTTKSGFNWGAYSITLNTSRTHMFIGGGFSMYGPYIFNRIIPLARDGSPRTFQEQRFGNDNAVTAIKYNSTINKFYVGGDFIYAQGRPYSGIVRLNSDGTVDTSFSIGTGLGGGRVTSLDIQSDGKVVVGGYFSTYNSVSRYGVVRINPNGSIDTTFNMNLGPGSVVHKVKVVGNYIYMVGYFNSSPHKNIIKHNITTNTSDMIFGTGFNGTVLTLDILTNGNLLVGGWFSKYRDVNWNRLVEISSTDGSFEGTPNVEEPSIPDPIITDPNRIATFEWLNEVFFNFKKTSFIPVNKKGVRKDELLSYYYIDPFVINQYTNNRLIPRGKCVASLSTPVITGTYVNDISFSPDGKTLICGNFDKFNYSKSINNIISIDINGVEDNTFGTGSDDTINCVKRQRDGKILIGGWFTTFNGVNSPGVVRLNNDGSIDTSFNVGTGVLASYGGVYSIEIDSQNRILIGGSFSEYNGTPLKNLARLNSNGVLDSTFVKITKISPLTGSSDHAIRSIKIDDNDNVYACGYFNDISINNSTAIIKTNGVLKINSNGVFNSVFTNNFFNRNVNDANVRFGYNTMDLYGPILMLGYNKYTNKNINPNNKTGELLLVTVYNDDSIFEHSTSFLTQSSNTQINHIRYISEKNLIMVGSTNNDGNPNGSIHCFNIVQNTGTNRNQQFTSISHSRSYITSNETLRCFVTNLRNDKIHYGLSYDYSTSYPLYGTVKLKPGDFPQHETPLTIKKYFTYKAVNNSCLDFSEGGLNFSSPIIGFENRVSIGDEWLDNYSILIKETDTYKLTHDITFSVDLEGQDNWGYPSFSSEYYTNLHVICNNKILYACNAGSSINMTLTKNDVICFGRLYNGNPTQSPYYSIMSVDSSGTFSLTNKI